MSEEKRTIKINTALFKIPDTRKNRKPKEQKEIKIKAPKKENNKTLKRSLLRFLRNHQEQNLNQLNSTNKNEIEKPKSTAMSEFNSDFNESLEYLTKLAKENDNNMSNINSHNKTLKQYPDYGNPTITEPIINTVVPIELMKHDFTNKITETIQQPNQPVSINYKHYPPPSYGCLKNGSLPTYRTLNKTQKNPIFNYTPTITNNNLINDNLINNNTNNLIPTYANVSANTPQIIDTNKMVDDMIQKSIIKQNMDKMANINNEQNQKNKKFVKKQKKTLRRTYNVGKSKMYSKISVLVSNKTIRKNITTKSQLLKQIPIQEVKKYLIQKGFIRVGSIAPNDVLRKMYETAILMCGEIQNHNPENLLYNYLNDKEE
jgi:hypothetical protein